MLWINYPNNPTAAVADLAFLAEAVEFAQANGLLLCHDAAYTQVNLEGDVCPSLLQVPGARQVAVELNSLSKSHNMAGWRLGVALGNPAALEKLMRVKAEADNGHFLAVTEAAIEALTGDQAWIVERNAEYRRRRDLVLRGLDQAGLRPSPSKATLYVWAGLPNGWRSEAFAAGLLGEAGVAVTPGDLYGSRGEGYIRISIGTPYERIAEGMRRLEAWVNASRLRSG
jgi:LL-diaminopimelate aminotransferase